MCIFEIMGRDYLFTSARLGFRNWNTEDIEPFTALNADPEVMQYFPKTLSRQESAEFMFRLQTHYQEQGFTYFAVDLLESGEWIGFIGLFTQDFPSSFTPAIDLGWRLTLESHGYGYATEGAKRCLAYAWSELSLKQVISICPLVNHVSERVMQKIGMQKQGEFKHPKLSAFPELENCCWYEIIRLS